MKGSGLFTLCLLAPVLCSGQDVLVSPAFEHASFSGDGYVDGAGASLGLRFPIADTRSTIELRPAYVWGTNVIRSLNYQREDRRAGACIGLIRARDLKENFTMEYGAEVGFHARWIGVTYNGQASAQQRSATLGVLIGIRASAAKSVQPFLSLHPFYERELSVQHTPFGYGESNDTLTGSQFGLSLCIGLMFGLPSQGSAWNE